MTSESLEVPTMPGTTPFATAPEPIAGRPFPQLTATYLDKAGELIREMEIRRGARPLERSDLVPILREAMLCRASSIRLCRPWLGGQSLDPAEILALCRLAAGAARVGIGPVWLRRESEGLGGFELSVHTSHGPAPATPTGDNLSAERHLDGPLTLTGFEISRFVQTCESALALGILLVSYRLVGAGERWVELRLDARALADLR